MKKVKRERKESESTPEEIARRKRKARRLAREARAKAPADEAKGHGDDDESEASGADAGVKVSARRRDPAPAERTWPLLDVKERCKTVITTDNILKMLQPGEQAKIEFCDRHHDELVRKLTLHGISGLILTDESKLVARLRAKRIEPLFQSCEALIKLAIHTVGTEGVIFHRCPVCALSKFDFLGQIAGAMKDAVRQQLKALQ
jgi:hypothetical protein